MHLTALLFIYSALLMTSIASATSVSTAAPISEWSVNQLEQRLEHIDTELGQLARFSLRAGMGSIGYRSFRHLTPEQTEWVQIDLESEAAIDQIVLVPTIWHDAVTGHRADCFPLQFQILAGTHEDSTGSVIASFDATDHLLPRSAPLIVPCDVKATWVRIETSLLSPAAFDGKYKLELSEVMIFSGEENVALRQTVQSPSNSFTSISRASNYLVDGFVPYVMHSGRGLHSNAYIGQVEPDTAPVLSLDLGETYPLNRIHLHAVDLNENSPQSHPSDFGIPRHMILEGGNLPDYSDASPLVEYRINSAFESGPVIMRNFPKTACRYVRLRVITPYHNSRDNSDNELVGFAEIELFSEDQNVALGKPIQSNLSVSNTGRSLVSLTDGLNTYGYILPIRAWINELALRHDLEVERPIIADELNRRYALQKTQLKWVSWLAALLAVGIGFTILIDRMLQIRKIMQVKERFAADLHDELGANIHTIDMLNEISRDTDSQEERDMLSDRISKVTERTATSIRYFSNMLAADQFHVGLVDDMRRATERIATNIKYDLTVEGADSLNQLKPLIRADLFLFYKESLINIIRHSGATQVRTHLEATAREIRLTISDNGIGISDSIGNEAPAALKRRAHLIGGKATAQRTPAGGTTITLILRPRRRPWRRTKL
ncbi:MULTISPECIES: sensor histidine kinase [unclassified Lentimonas]|uniref:sensor histidine kinase n=1 Tax=unclassified Lentimonas TaxID=2630993 RepID=UPI0013215B73|nr:MULTISPECIES: hypothetical protein [unclassified Lentimonas]CAA6677638.1 Unannotated [Lentimonas sp. CC4]CAA6684901.1 Unannotated [Lentimonas sp. CC6]CAA7077986.1 Unannotated [Lentimonas sp. CC4]CAA7169907.1 Unannotated [Lentimonas sp. CC21]CAA7180143.1 Unannotated [Lentimonas sp. CC8]